MLAQLVIGAILLLVMYAALFNKMLLLYLYAGALPFLGIISEVGVQITPVLVVGLGMLANMVIGRLGNIRVQYLLLVYMVFAIVMSILMSFFLPEDVNKYPFLRGRGRWVGQIIVFILVMAPVIYFMHVKPGFKQISLVINVFIATVVILVIIGFIQLLYFNKTGIDLFPINLFNPESNENVYRSALTRAGYRFKIFRISSFGAGEPKHLGYSCVIAFALVLIKMVWNRSSSFKKRAFQGSLALILAAGIFLTLSTQSYIMVMLDLVIVFFIILLVRGFRSIIVWYFLASFAIFGFFAFKFEYVRKLIEARTIERLSDTGALEDFNQTVIDFLKDQPSFILTGTGMGNVHFWAADYIPSRYKYYMRNNVFVAKAGALRLISEQGILGFVFFYGFVCYVLYLLRKIKNNNAPFSGLAFFTFLVIVIINFSVTMDGPPYYAFALALSSGYIYQARNQVNLAYDYNKA